MVRSFLWAIFHLQAVFSLLDTRKPVQSAQQVISLMPGAKTEVAEVLDTTLRRMSDSVTTNLKGCFSPDHSSDWRTTVRLLRGCEA